MKEEDRLFVCCPTHHVCAVGKVLCVGAAMIWKEGQRVLNPPGGSWEDPVVNCSRRANSSWVKLDTTAQNHFITCAEHKTNIFNRWPAAGRKHRRRISMTYFLSEVPRSSYNHSMSFEVLHVYITGATHQQLKRFKKKEISITQWRF